MIKRSCIALLLLISFAAAAQEITASIKAPAAVQPGSDFTVEITVNKPGVNGFMKYFQDLPIGFSAAEIESKGGSFTFADNAVKIIWIAPPSSDQFVISYKITAPANAAGISIGGKFSYISGSERKVFEVSPEVINIGQPAAAAKDPVKKMVKETPDVETAVPSETKTAAEEKKTAAPPAETTKSAEITKPAAAKKETSFSLVPEAKAPVSAAASAGKTYRVQIGAFSMKPHLEGVPESSSILLDNGMTKYFSGNFKTYEEAVKRKKEMIDKGFAGAFIVSFENGKIVK